MGLEMKVKRNVLKKLTPSYKNPFFQAGHSLTRKLFIKLIFLFNKTSNRSMSEVGQNFQPKRFQVLKSHNMTIPAIKIRE